MLTVITNNVPRDIIAEWQLTADQRKEFDYLDWEAMDAGTDSRSFCMYRGELYDLQEICEASWGSSMPEGLRGWTNYASDSFFSGVVIRYVDNCERVVFGRYYA